MSDASANSRAARQVDDLSFYGRLRFTPISDAFRGELSARLSVAYAIDAANLPSPLPQTIMKLVRRTRLWRRERLEVAHELISHFQDGLSAGAAPDQLVRDFGNIDRAAKLIRRAKKRNRPLIWKTAVRSAQAIALLPLIVVLLYVPIAIRFFMGAPSITHDYLADLNRVAVAVPQDQRAWPVYREALKGLQSPTELAPVTDPTTAPHPAGVKPGDEHWPVYEQYIRDNADRVALIRKAAAMPGLGFVASAELSPEDAELWPPKEGVKSFEGPLLYSVLLPYLGEMRKLAYLLVIDARRAAGEGDGQAVVDNIVAILGIAKQARENPLFIGDLVTLAIAQMALERVGEFIAVQPGLFSDSQLRDLAHGIASLTNDDLRVRVSAERLSFHDFVQHAYTNDGGGDGRMTLKGLRMLEGFSTQGQDGWLAEGDWRVTAAPALALVAMNRRDILQKYDELLNDMEINGDRPLWKRENSGGVNSLIPYLDQSTVGHWRYLPLIRLMPAIDHATTLHHYARTSRDATLTAIALELYRRRHGQWPETLSNLLPSLLPALPVDPFDGQTLRYKIEGDGVVLYSIGADRVDDGGAPAQEARPQSAGSYPRPWSRSTNAGDWVLWPPTN